MDELTKREKLASMEPNYKPKATIIMEDNCTGLVFPFHINHALKSDVNYYNPKINDFHAHDFNEIVVLANDDKKAFYLTEDDKEFYSKQELDVLNKILNSTK